ncbi:protein-glutamine gamma-glutamyltransferase E-like [Rana temporaria]|uniref:protein-glutamine gamma-glutamyltransferase E-like n=1 Tax=Rana temporaria TaxID=8407 RepID=UPI001AACA88B|nr:protein-glutamine gamma-glutamyltransferase E-like [Rana temporaria]
MDESNKKAHHTDMFNSSELILRRGQSCRLTLEFNKPLRDWQSIVFVARTGPPNSGYANTNVEFPLSSSWSSGMWSAVLESSPGNSLKIIMSSPATAVIGRYDLSVRIAVMGQTVTYSLGKFILLFNPWCLDDDVYMANEEERKEYILNDHGVVFMGNEKHVTGMGWNYGQFENNILNICLDILDRSLDHQKDPGLDCSLRYSPIYVGRVISAMVNSNDDFGVLEGKWEKDFSDGADPNSWNGSVEILWKWKNDEYKPVKYGQCWVFAAVMCTALRCLGIPTRVITNFNSAHNTDGNMVIDMHYDTDGKFLELSDDSIWNFHVWNESWFLRRDLGLYYSGWQVLDSTPQEQSQGVHRCGPTSVIAVKEGDIHLSFDTPFVFAEVNADRATWVVQKDGTKERAHSDSKYIGQSISTKAVGNDSRVDVTLNYKYPEGSPQERQVFEKASRSMPNYVPPKENVSPEPNNMMNRNSSPMRSSTPTPISDLNGRSSSPSPSSGRTVQPRSEYRSASPSPSLPAAERGRSSTPTRYLGRPSTVQPSENEYLPAIARPASPALFSGRSVQPRSGNEYRAASPSPVAERGRSSSPVPFSGLPSSVQPSGTEFRPGSPLLVSPIARPSSPALFSGRSSPTPLSGSRYRPASPSPNFPVVASGRSSSPVSFSGRPSSAQPSGIGYRPASPSPNLMAAPTGRPLSPALGTGHASPVPPPGIGYRPASPSPAALTGRPSSPSLFSGYPSHASNSVNAYRPAPRTSGVPQPSSSASPGTDVAGKFRLLSPLVVGDDINLLLDLKNLTPYHRPVKVMLSASAVLYTGKRMNDIFTDQKSLIISPNQDAHISLQIPYSHYSKGLNEGNMIQVVALCELPFGAKVVVTKDLVLESPPIIIKPLSTAMLHKTMSLEIRFTNPLPMAVTDCTLVVEGSGLVDRQLIAVVPYLKPNERIKFKVELTPYRSGTRQLIANFKCRYFSIKGYQLINVESW